MSFSAITKNASSHTSTMLVLRFLTIHFWKLLPTGQADCCEIFCRHCHCYFRWSGWYSNWRMGL